MIFVDRYSYAGRDCRRCDSGGGTPAVGAGPVHTCVYLMEQGFDNVVNLRGGILDWARGGFQIVQRLGI